MEVKINNPMPFQKVEMEVYSLLNIIRFYSSRAIQVLSDPFARSALPVSKGNYGAAK